MGTTDVASTRRESFEGKLDGQLEPVGSVKSQGRSGEPSVDQNEVVSDEVIHAILKNQKSTTLEAGGATQATSSQATSSSFRPQSPEGNAAASVGVAVTLASQENLTAEEAEEGKKAQSQPSYVSFRDDREFQALQKASNQPPLLSRVSAFGASLFGGAKPVETQQEGAQGSETITAGTPDVVDGEEAQKEKEQGAERRELPGAAFQGAQAPTPTRASGQLQEELHPPGCGYGEPVTAQYFERERQRVAQKLAQQQSAMDEMMKFLREQADNLILKAVRFIPEGRLQLSTCFPAIAKDWNEADRQEKVSRIKRRAAELRNTSNTAGFTLENAKQCLFVSDIKKFDRLSRVITLIDDSIKKVVALSADSRRTDEQKRDGSVTRDAIFNPETIRAELISIQNEVLGAVNTLRTDTGEQKVMNAQRLMGGLFSVFPAMNKPASSGGTTPKPMPKSDTMKLLDETSRAFSQRPGVACS